MTVAPRSLNPVRFDTAAEFFNWQPEDANPLMFATVPLAQRIPPPNELRMLVGLDMGPWTYWPEFDANPQGGPRGNVYNFQYWQYVDMIYYMPRALAGVPPAVWTNAAHRNGVKVCAVVYRGEETVPEFDKLFADPQKAAAKLHLIAQTCGFDGWMIDVEGWSNATKDLKDNVQNAMAALCSMKLPNGQATEAGYYEAWQYDINDDTYPFFQAGTLFQSDYTNEPGYPKKSYQYLQDPKHTGNRFATYWSVYVYGYPGSKDGGGLFNGYDYLDIKGFFDQLVQAKMPDSKYYQSIGIYAPDWTMYGGHDDTKDPLPTRDVFHKTDRLFWVGDNPTIADDGTLKTAKPAVSNFIPARSSIVAQPFVTSFNTGEGSFFVVSGNRFAEGEWSYLSSQDRLPTWLVPVAGSETTVSADYSYDYAYDGGSSLAFKGKLEPSKQVEYALYLTDIDLQNEVVASFTYMLRNASSVLPYLKLKFSNGADTTVPGKDRKDGWVHVSQLVPQQSLKLVSIHLGFVNESLETAIVDAVVGQLRVFIPPDLPPPSILTPELNDQLLTWSAPVGWGEIWYYNIFFSLSDQEIFFVGRTFGASYDLSAPLFQRPSGAGNFLVQPVTGWGISSPIT